MTYPYGHGYSHPYYRRQLGPVKAAATRVGGLTAENIHLELPELRQELGLFSDTSQDDLITDLALTATERIGEMVGGTLAAVPVDDFYPRLPYGDRLILSQRGVTAATDVTVRVRTFATPEAETELAADTWTLDTTARRAGVHVHRGAVVPQLSERHENPVRVSYTPAGAGVAEGTPAAFRGREQIRSAIRYWVSVHFEARGTGMLPPGWQRGLVQILGQHALTFGA